MNILAIDTATEACSAAVYHAGAIVERSELTPREHGERILTMVEEVLGEVGFRLSDLDGIAFGCGPGSFTGVRLAVSVTQGLALGARLPVVPISTLAALAQEAPGNRVLVALDARMEEVYWGTYQRHSNGLVRALAPDKVCSPAAICPPPGSGWVGAGGGWQRYGASLSSRIGDCASAVHPTVLPTARAVALLGAYAYDGGTRLQAQEALPTYLRDQVVRPR